MNSTRIGISLDVSSDISRAMPFLNEWPSVYSTYWEVIDTVLYILLFRSSSKSSSSVFKRVAHGLHSKIYSNTATLLKYCWNIEIFNNTTGKQPWQNSKSIKLTTTNHFQVKLLENINKSITKTINFIHLNFKNYWYKISIF